MRRVRIPKTSNVEHTSCTECVAGHYWHSDAAEGFECVSCPANVICEARSQLADWQHEGYWRVDDESDRVYECRFGRTSCPGTSVLDDDGDTNCSNAKWPYCKCGYTGALCAVCAPNYYESWGGTQCVDCENEQGHAHAIAIGASLFVFTIASVGIAITQRKRIVNSARWRTARYLYRLGRVKMRVVFFALQVLSEFSLISTKTVQSGSDGGFPEPAATFSRMLGVANFDVIGLVPMGCVLPEATFHSKLVAKTVGPIIPVALLWAWPATRVITGASKVKQQHSARFAAKCSLLWLELTLASVSTTIFETFVCSGFDGEYFLNAQLTIPCDGSPRRIAWEVYAGLAVGLYPVGTLIHGMSSANT